VKTKQIAPGLVTNLAPEHEIQLGEFGLEWAVAKPVDLTASHGINITAERLEEMVAAYDPEAIEAAPINFDHAFGGPALGWIESIAVRDGLLWVRPVELSQEVIQGIAAGRYRRASIEFATKHPETGGWYLNGVAVLGNAKPAIKGLPPLRLAAPRYVIDLTESTVPADAPPAAPEDDPVTPPEEPGQEEDMPESKNPEASGAAAVAEEDKKQSLWAALGELLGITPKAEPAKVAATATAGLTLADVDARIAEARLTDSVERDLADLRDKVPPAVLNDPETRALLMEAKAKGPDRYRAALKLVAGADASELLSGPVASAEQTGSGHTGLGINAHELAACEAAGLDAKRIAEIERKFNLKVN
jgi:hypothetical protein